jgi:hypothetical protein
MEGHFGPCLGRPGVVRVSPAQLFPGSTGKRLGGTVPFGRNELWVALVGRHTGRVTRVLAEWPDSDSVRWMA